MPEVSGKLNGRVALITGASRGIGAALAKRYAAEGAQVVLTARTQAGLEEVDDAIRTASDGTVQATLVPIDLKNGDDIDRLAAAIAERFGRLDILVANAAILGDMSPVSHIEPADWDEVVAVNLTANWRLVRALEALLLESDAGRAIFLTSGVAGGRAYWGSYAITKTAIEALARTWAEEMDKTSLRINTVNPGGVRTVMRAKAYPGEDPAKLSSPDNITDIFVELATTTCMRHGEILNAQ
ncbi:MAG: NAD(P)-dependent dehydrogenase (short-subunit alcohol dehydrogenase family) [Alphaproteobacteria bacterium]|jgi:NAD(P)-dependent dehydrogenase (short-subunit alcohol dehydrogenase family)